ncbi:MAG: hypothetical protein ABH858_03120 [Candidatus Omnitrophota bacterium]
MITVIDFTAADTMKKTMRFLVVLFLCVFVYFFFQKFSFYFQESKILKETIFRLEADSRIAKVIVTATNIDKKTKKPITTIKFLEYDTQGEPLPPRYFTFLGDIIQFQSLAIRFNDFYVKKKDDLRGKSIYLFWKVFVLDGANTQEFEITKINSIPSGYKVADNNHPFEKKLWENFWLYALDPLQAEKVGIKNAQIEAPGTLFKTGTIYTIKIEHDGGMRIDAEPIPFILQGESMPK